MNFDQRIWFGVWKEQFPPNFSPQHNSDSLFLRSRWQRLCQSVCARLKFPLWQLTRSYLMQYSLSSCIYFIFQALQELSSHNHNHLSCNNSNLSTLHTYGAAPLDALILRFHFSWRLIKMCIILKIKIERTFSGFYIVEISPVRLCVITHEYWRRLIAHLAVVVCCR